VAAEVRAERLPRAQAELLIGFVMLEPALGRDVEPSCATFYRRCQHLRRMNLLADRPVAEPIMIAGL